MNPTRIGTLCASAVAVAAGVVYLLAGKASLPFVLPVMTLCFGAIAFLRAREAKRCAVEGGFLANLALYLPAVAAGAVAFFAAVGTVAWFAGR